MKAFLNWSGGKDSALCLHTAIQQRIPVEALVTTISQQHQRISMHGVRRILLERQVAALHLPLHILEMPEQANMTVYEGLIGRSNTELKAEGFTHAVSGDLFLEDLKAYREQLYAKDSLETLFPLWQKNTAKLLDDFLSLGFKAVIVCVNTNFLDACFCGRMLDASFIRDLPPGVDPCGENGEYHSFVFDGPVFSQPVQFTRGEIVYREFPAPVKDDCFQEPAPAAGFYFQDLLPPCNGLILGHEP